MARKKFKDVEEAIVPPHRSTIIDVVSDMNEFDQDAPIFVHTRDRKDMMILSVYGDDDGLHIDVGEAGE